MADKKAKKKKIRKADKKVLKSRSKKTSKSPNLKTTKKIKTTVNVPRSQKPSKKVKPKTAAKKKKAVKSPVLQKSVTEEERKATLRNILLDKRKEIIKEAKSEISKYIKGETKQLVDTALDDGDWSVVDLSEDISLKQLSTHRETLHKIDEVLRKINEGTYGICEDCGEEISEKRLSVMPFAIYCIDCQEKREQLEEIKRIEG
ncbi:MAG: TraR/DksA C4-type zinc finger protein [Nitrospirota bacterium]